MPTKSQAIKNFLTARTHPDLAALYSLGMECQVNVAQDGGTRIEEEYKGRMWHGWTDNVQTWKSFRIPYNAKTKPEFEDHPIKFDLEAHAEGIGLTGWNWQDLRSQWVAFDFDGITGHSDKHGAKLTEAELAAVKQAACEIPWVTVRKSTSGSGLHLYVNVDVETANHTEHAALGRAILSEMSGLVGFDFQTKVDCCGGNMWFWHRKMKGTDGLTVIKQGVELFDVPEHWRDHIAVVNGSRKKTKPNYILGDTFDDLTNQRPLIELDPEHMKLIEWLKSNGCCAWWESDHKALVTHTYHLKEAHAALSLKGVFETVSVGREKGVDKNCFLFPLRRGAWSVRRFSPGCKEAATWVQDAGGWTMCHYNADADLSIAARTFSGVENEKGGYEFNDAESAKHAAALLGAHFDLQPQYLHRPATLKAHKDGRLIVELEKRGSDSGLEGWLDEKGKLWKKIFNVGVGTRPEPEVGNYDDFIRHMVTVTGEDVGWGLKSGGTEWNWEPLTHIQRVLQADGLSTKEINNIIGKSVVKCWKLVNMPFQPEYPGDRCWNRDAAKFRFAPSQAEELSYPTWSRIFKHCGASLDGDIARHPWCITHGILTGADYLKLWVASMFQFPAEPLPYLFFYGDQGGGKSMFHEAVSRLLDGGYCRADTSLSSDYNGELANAILCAVEEKNLSKNKQAYDRIKDFVTSRQISIHPKFGTPYLTTNTTHWVQCSNDPTACPVMPGDTRITMVRTEAIDPFDPDPNKRMIPKKVLEQLLDKEAPDFLADILKLEIPMSCDRLNIPVIVTEDKALATKSNQNQLQAFISDVCYHVEGEAVLCSEFYERFWAWLESTAEIQNWTKIRIGREMPFIYPKGRITTGGGGGNFHFGNMSFENVPKSQPKWRYDSNLERLAREA